MIYSLIFGILLALAAFLAFKMAVADWRRRIIPDVYLFPFMLIGLLVLVFGRWPVGITDGVLGGLWGMRRRARFIPFAPFFMVGAIIALLGLWFLL